MRANVWAHLRRKTEREPDMGSTVNLRGNGTGHAECEGHWFGVWQTDEMFLSVLTMSLRMGSSGGGKMGWNGRECLGKPVDILLGDTEDTHCVALQ
jgi:hypothetical protein